MEMFGDMEDVSENNYFYTFQSDGTLVKSVFSQLENEQKEYRRRYKIEQGLLLVSQSDAVASPFVAWPLRHVDGDRLSVGTLVLER